MDEERLTDSESVALFLRVLAEEMVEEMGKRGLLSALEHPMIRIDNPDLGPMHARIAGLERENAQLRAENEHLVRDLAWANTQLSEVVVECVHPRQPDDAEAKIRKVRYVGQPTPEELEPTEPVDDVHEVLTALPLKKTCESCLKRSGGVCRSRVSKYANQQVGAAQPACTGHVRRPNPPASPVYRPAFTRLGREMGPCIACGHVVLLKRDGNPFAHDTSGRLYRGKNGADKSQPCPGKAVKK
jgi:hypothetical protein